MYVIVDRTEEAFAALIGAAVTAAYAQNVPQVLTSKNSADLALSNVVALADGAGAQEDPFGSGNYWIDVTIGIRTIAVQNQSGTGPDATPKTTSENLVSVVSLALMTNTLAAQLSTAVADYTALAVIPHSPGSGKDPRGAWMDELHFKVYCCASALAA